MGQAVKTLQHPITALRWYAGAIVLHKQKQAVGIGLQA